MSDDGSDSPPQRGMHCPTQRWCARASHPPFPRTKSAGSRIRSCAGLDTSRVNLCAILAAGLAALALWKGGRWVGWGVGGMGLGELKSAARV